MYGTVSPGFGSVVSPLASVRTCPRAYGLRRNFSLLRVDFGFSSSLRYRSVGYLPGRGISCSGASISLGVVGDLRWSLVVGSSRSGTSSLVSALRGDDRMAVKRMARCLSCLQTTTCVVYARQTCAARPETGRTPSLLSPL